MSLPTRLATYYKLGLRSLFDVGIYRIGLKIGLHPVLKITPSKIRDGDFFVSVAESLNQTLCPTEIWQDRPWAFGKPVGEPSDEPPDWHTNIITGAKCNNVDAHWANISAFSSDVEDIKTVWEASRFDWLLAFSQNARADIADALKKINAWLTDWNLHNPAYYGPNWICGQEASIRTVHLLIAAYILDNDIPISSPLEAMLLTHLRRIAPTIGYARGQNNNHATSEAMALYVGGLCLSKRSKNKDTIDEALNYMSIGQSLAEERVNALIFSDGGFAQYSFVYHRLMLDSLSVMELFREKLGASKFHSTYYDKAKLASQWLRFFTDSTTGEVPNIGSNDGAMLLPIGNVEYRDFRASCALASTLFEGRTYFSEANCVADMLGWLAVPISNPKVKEKTPRVKIFPDSGLGALSDGDICIYLRLPGYKFRPHQADALHVDIWKSGENLFCDSGTYSYAKEGWEYFPSTAAHNTVEFDRRDQMPRISRFLYEKWTKRQTLESVENDDFSSLSSSYTDYRNMRHKRTVLLYSDRIIIKDSLSGNFKTASLFWRLGTAANPMESKSSNQQLEINVSLKGKNIEPVLKKGKTSLYYYECERIDLMEYMVLDKSNITTEIKV